MLLRVLILAVFAILSTVPASADIILTLDNPIQSGLPGKGVIFTGTITNTNPGIFIAQSFEPTVDAPFEVLVPLALAGPLPASYTGTIFGIAIHSNATRGEKLLTSAFITGMMDDMLIESNKVPIEVTVGPVPEPGSALLVAIPVMLAILVRRRHHFFPVSR